MKLRNVTIAAIVSAIGLTVVPVASADDFTPPPWSRDYTYAITAEWEFATTAAILTAIVPDGPLTNVDAKASGTIGGGVSFASVSDGGVWEAGDGDGKWTFPDAPGTIHFEVDNIVDFRPVKHMWVQVTHDPTPPSSGLGLVPLAFTFDNVVGFGVFQTPVIVEPLSDIHTRFRWDIYPNPDWEEFDLIVPEGIGIDQVVVDTISVPVPAALPVGMVLLGGLAFLRRVRR